MSLIGRYKLSRDRNVTVANLVDEVVRRRRDGEVSVNENGPFLLSQLHATICAMDAFLRDTVGLSAGQPVAIYQIGRAHV